LFWRAESDNNADEKFRMFLHGIGAAPLHASRYRELLAALDAAVVPAPEILHLYNVRPHIAGHFTRVIDAVLRSPSSLDPALREVLAAFAAKSLASFALLPAHAAVASELYGHPDFVARVLDEYETAPLADREKELFAFVERVVRNQRLAQADIDRLLGAGWSEDVVLDAALLCAVVQFEAVLARATGLNESPPKTHRVWGRHVTQHGYVLD
jgi:alkylhydroperoxidase family enzyme